MRTTLALADVLIFVGTSLLICLESSVQLTLTEYIVAVYAMLASFSVMPLAVSSLLDAPVLRT